MKTKLWLLLGLMGLVGCERASEKSNVVIKLPLIPKHGPMSVQPKMIQSSSGGSWGLPLPTVNSDIKCFAVFVAKSDAAQNNKSCSKGQGSSFATFSFNEFKGFAAQGSSIEFSLDAGPGYKFYVLGVNSADGTCPSFINPDLLDTNLLSNPMFLGQTSADLVAGDNNIDIPFSVPSSPDSQAIQNCSFFPGGGAPTKLDLHGGISTKDGFLESSLGVGTCNRVRLTLESDNGDAIVDQDLSLALSVIGSVGAFKENADCSGSVVTSALLEKGYRYKDVYFEAHMTPGMNGTVAVSTSYNGSVLQNSKDVQTGAFSSPMQIRFFDDSLKMSANSCVEVPFFAVDEFGFTADVDPGTPLGVYDLDGVDRSGEAPGVMPNFDFKDSCAGSAIVEFPDGMAHGSVAVQMGAERHLDFRVGNDSLFAFLNVNLVPRADDLQLSSAQLSPYASDCTAFNVKAVDINGIVPDFSALDSSPFGDLGRQVRAQIYADSAYADVYTDSQCLTPNYSEVSLFNGNLGQINPYIQFSGTQAVAVRAWGGDFLTSRDENLLYFSPLWDPGAFEDLGVNNVTFLRAPAVDPSASHFPTKTNWGGMTFSVSGNPVATPNDLGTGNHSLTVDGSNFLNSTVSPSPTSVSYGILAYFNGTSASTNVVIMNSAAGNLATLRFASAGNLEVSGRHAGAPVGSSGTPVNVVTSTWYAVHIVRNVPAQTCSIYLNGTFQVQIACDDGGAIDSLSLGVAADSFKLGEFFMVDKVLSSAEISQHYNYLKQRYPAAGLPTP